MSRQKEMSSSFDLECQIRKWKSHLQSQESIGPEDLEELESHVRDSVEELMNKGLSIEESFLIAVRRLGEIEIINEEFAKVSTEDVWRQLFIPAATVSDAKRNKLELIIVLALAVFGGLLSRIPMLFGYVDLDAHALVYVRNAALFAFFPVILYVFWKRSLSLIKSLVAFAVCLVFAIVINAYPSYEPHHTQILGAIHMPIIMLYLLMYFFGSSYPSGWRHPNTRLNFVRFIGEGFIFTVLIGLGGMVLIGLTVGTFELMEIDIAMFVQNWMAPCGLFGIFPIAAYLVEQKKNLIESIAPVLSRIFTPLFFFVLLALIGGFFIHFTAVWENRSTLIWFDIILVLALALTLYSMGAKDSQKESRATVWDMMTLALLLAAIVVDAIALTGIVIRLSRFGFTANKSAALGENIILLANLILLAIGYIRYGTKKGTFGHIVAMQMYFLEIYALWATIVVVLFPIIFGFA